MKPSIRLYRIPVHSGDSEVEEDSTSEEEEEEVLEEEEEEEEEEDIAVDPDE